MDIFYSSDCSGDYEQEIDPIDVCFEDDSGDYIYNVCPGFQDHNANKHIAHSTNKFRLPKVVAAKLRNKKH